MAFDKVIIGNAELYHGDCREVLPTLPNVDAVITDPPYAIGKAEWDTEFPDWLFPLAAQVSPVLAVMPGTWNLLRCPERVGDLTYRWTLSAYLKNGMTRGAVGYSNWIPCLLYSAHNPLKWCPSFADWCEANKVTRSDLDRIAGTSDMGGWWMSRLAHRSQIPSPEQWERLRLALQPPAEFDRLVYASVHISDGDSREFAIGTDDKPDHPSPKPLSVMQWIMGRIKSKTVCDSFMGSGTTGVAAMEMGKQFIGIEKERKYFDIACERIERAQQQLKLW